MDFFRLVLGLLEMGPHSLLWHTKAKQSGASSEQPASVTALEAALTHCSRMYAVLLVYYFHLRPHVPTLRMNQTPTAPCQRMLITWY